MNQLNYRLKSIVNNNYIDLEIYINDIKIALKQINLL